MQVFSHKGRVYNDIRHTCSLLVNSQFQMGEPEQCLQDFSGGGTLNSSINYVVTIYLYWVIFSHTHTRKHARARARARVCVKAQLLEIFNR